MTDPAVAILPKELEEHIMQLANLLPISYRLRHGVKPRPVRIPNKDRGALTRSAFEPCTVTSLLRDCVEKWVEADTEYGRFLVADKLFNKSPALRKLRRATKTLNIPYDVPWNHIDYFIGATNDVWGKRMWAHVPCHAGMHRNHEQLRAQIDSLHPTV